MSYEEGKQQLVTKYQIFNASVYDTMHGSFRGHTRFYAYTWEEMLFNRGLPPALIHWVGMIFFAKGLALHGVSECFCAVLCRCFKCMCATHILYLT